MAIEAERLLATFEARFSSLEKALSKARGDATRAFGDIEAAGTRAESTLASIGSRGAPGIGRYTQAARGAKVETANLAAQINDIGVQLAGGQSPFLIAVQQGTQINQALGQAGARGAVAALGGAFMSLVNPVSLATIAIIGLGGAAVQYFASLLMDSSKSEEALKRQADLIQQVAQRWGDAIPALKAYADEVIRAKEATDAIAAGEAVASAQYDQMRGKVSDLSIAFAGLVQEVMDFGGSYTEIAALQEAFNEFEEKLASSTATAEDAKRVQEGLLALFGVTGQSAVEGMAGSFGLMADQLDKVSAAAQRARADVAAALQMQNLPGNLGQLTPLHSGGGKFLNEQEAMDFRASNTKSQFQLDQEKAARQRSRKTPTPYNDSVESTSERTDTLREEIELMRIYGASVDELAFQLDRARMARELMNAAEQQGLVITPELEGEIAKIATAYAAAAEEKRKLGEAQDGIRKSLEEINSLGKDILGGFISDLRNGVSAAEALRNALNRLLDKLLELALNSIFESINLGSLIGGGGTPGRAGGGPVRKGKPYVVGERRQELFVPDQSGRILSSVPSGPTDAAAGLRSSPPRMVFQINDYAGEPMSATQQRQSNGDVLVKMIIGEVKKDYAKGGFNKLNASLYGQTPQKRRKG